MTRPEWWSQKFAAEGAAAAEGISRQLGRPALDPLTIMVREAAQNSWDARSGPEEVAFSVEIRTIRPEDAWRELLPGPLGGDEALRAAVAPGSTCIVVSDRGTRGLGGPLRADEKAPDGITPDFVQFLRNVGEPSDQKLGGGTYGFGKGSLYGISGAHTILVDSLSSQGFGPRRRLMGASLGHSFYSDNTRYTGRHWWGDCSHDIPYPLVDEEAALWSKRLGLPGFEDGRSGTDVVIVGAQLGSQGDEAGESPRTPREAAEFIASSMLWHLWPKAGSDLRHPDMRFTVRVNGEEILVPSPTAVPELAGFSEALDRVVQGEGAQYRRSATPLHAGDLALVTVPAEPASRGDLGRVLALARPFSLPYRHVARMRQAQLVVDYFDGPTHLDAMLGYAGVFVASKEANASFAAAEPPTHDSWVVNGLTGYQRGVVQNLSRFIKLEIASHLPQPAHKAGPSSGLGRFASELGNLVTARGSGAGGMSAKAEPVERGAGDAPAATRREKRRRPTVPALSSGPTLVVRNGQPRLEAWVSVPPGLRDRRLALSPVVVLANGAAESDPPTGAPCPVVLGWWESGASDFESPGADTYVVRASTAEKMVGVAVGYVPDATVRFRLSSEEL